MAHANEKADKAVSVTAPKKSEKNARVMLGDRAVKGRGGGK